LTISSEAGSKLEIPATTQPFSGSERLGLRQLTVEESRDGGGYAIKRPDKKPARITGSSNTPQLYIIEFR
jgi:hypothetical protein